MKKEKLRTWVKVVLFILGVALFTTCLVKIIDSRFERIENGTMELMDHNGGER